MDSQSTGPKTTINWEKSGEHATSFCGKNDPNYPQQAMSEALNEAIAPSIQTQKRIQRITWICAPRIAISPLWPFYF